MIETLAIIAIIVLIVVRMAQTEIGGKVWKNTFTRLNSPACPPATGTTSACPPAQTATKSPTKNRVGMIVVMALLAVVGYNYFTGKSTLGFGGYSKTFEVGVRNYNDQKVCGLPSGDGMRFKLPHNVYVMLQNGTSRFINGDILIENTIEGEEFSVKKDGCVTMTLSRMLEFKESSNSTLRDPQRFRIQFYR